MLRGEGRVRGVAPVRWADGAVPGGRGRRGVLKSHLRKVGLARSGGTPRGLEELKLNPAAGDIRADWMSTG